MTDRETNLEIIEDALKRCDGILRDTISQEMSPAAWDVVSPGDEHYEAVCGLLGVEPRHWDVGSLEDEPAEEGEADSDEMPYVHPTGPEWEGLPGTHPLLPFIRRARAALQELRGESLQELRGESWRLPDTSTR
jgi:hypothetical protein